MKNKITTIMLLLLVMITPNVAFADTAIVEPNEVNITNYLKGEQALLSMTIDEQGRAHQSHYIGSDSDQEGKRVGDTPNPINISKNDWLNFKDGDKWFWDRGHLVGNQFAGYASNNPENIMGQTYYSNQVLMLYFEGGKKSSNDNALDNWLYLHPNYVIDYTVTANYNDDLDRYPTTITLKYRGMTKDSSQTPVEIRLPDLDKEGAGKQETDKDFFTSVNLGNIVPGYSINYKTGHAEKGDPDTSINDNTQVPNNTEEQKSKDGLLDLIIKLIESFFK